MVLRLRQRHVLMHMHMRCIADLIRQAEQARSSDVEGSCLTSTVAVCGVLGWRRAQMGMKGNESWYSERSIVR